jgi:hypothetical protein
VPGRCQPKCPVVVHLRQAQPAVLLLDFHPEGADRLEPVQCVIGDLCVAFDLERIYLRFKKFTQPREETLALLNRLRIRPRLRMDKVEPEVAKEQLPAETRQLGLDLAATAVLLV